VDNDQLNDDFKAAAMFIEEIIKGKLLAAKYRNIQYNASYGGGAIPFGYVVDGLGDGSAERKFYRVYEPHAVLIRWLFKEFRNLGGNLPLLVRELERMDFRFPPFEQGITPYVGLLADEDGSYPLRTRKAVISALTNRAYIGWYIYGGVLVSREAHTPVVSMDDFQYAFERLSSTTLDGTEEQERKPRERRYGGASALLDGVVESNGIPVYVDGDDYDAVVQRNGFGRTDLSVPVQKLDAAFAMALVALLATLELKKEHSTASALYEQVKALQQEQEEQVSTLDKALARIDQEIANAEMAQRVSKKLGDEQGYSTATKELVQLRKDRVAIEAKIEQASNEASELAECQDLIECAVHDWQSMKMSKRKRLVRLVVASANLTKASPHFVRLDVTLAQPLSGSIVLYLYRTRGSQIKWTIDEDATLKESFPSATKEALLQTLPNRSWSSIVQRGYKLTGVWRSFTLEEKLTYSDMQLIESGLASTERPTWTTESEQVCSTVRTHAIKWKVRSPIPLDLHSRL
jgi:hypothetical protein